MSPILLAVIAVLLGSLGQVLWKHGLKFINYTVKGFLGPYGWLEILKNGWIPAGVVCYFTSMVLWLEALRRGELSQIYPLLSLNFIILTVMGHLLFHEHIGISRILGILLITCGIILIAQSKV